MGAAQHRKLVHTEIDNAVGHHHVETFGLQIELVEFFEIAFEKAHIGLAIAKLLHVPVSVGLGGGQLLVGHIDTDNLATRAHELGDQIDIAPRARAKVENAAAFKRGGNDDAAAIIFGPDLFVHIGDRRFEIAGHATAVATGRGF